VTAWLVAWTATGSRSLSLLPEKVATAVIEFVYGPLVENPNRVSKPLRFELEGLHVARRGDYRVIYEIDGDAQRIVVHVIEHRSSAYRQR
jgi:mRNA-degrading endonuclease RelE of RelBE toxin-antitoxin system